MRLNKRRFLALTGWAGIGAALRPGLAAAQPALPAMTRDAVPIGANERKTRVAKARRLRGY